MAANLSVDHLALSCLADSPLIGQVSRKGDSMDRTDQFRGAAACFNRDRDWTRWRYPQSLRRLVVEHAGTGASRRCRSAGSLRSFGIGTVTLGRWIWEGSLEERLAWRPMGVARQNCIRASDRR